MSAEVGLEVLLWESLSEEKPCEVEGHGEGLPHGVGPGEWYIVTQCPGCGDMATDLVCESLKRFIERDLVQFGCVTCDHWQAKASDALLRIEKR